MAFAEKDGNIPTNPLGRIVKQRRVKHTSSYKDVGFSTSIPAINFKGTFKATTPSTLHIKLADRHPSSAQGWRRSAFKKKKSPGEENAPSVVIHMDVGPDLTRQISLFL